MVQKFGGSSLATAADVARAARVVGEAYQRGDRVVVVVSARGNTTDELLALAADISPTRSERDVDQLLATGEIVSSAVMALALQAIGVPGVSMTGAQAGIAAAGSHTAGVIDDIDAAALTDVLSRGLVPVVAGFQGVNEAGDVVTLGRGGSDTTAVALAARLHARCEIFTDVDGIYTGDPRHVAGARLLPAVDAPVMAEMAFAGARVMHSRAVELAALTDVDIEVRSARAGRPGTTIAAAAGEAMELRGAIVAIAHDLDIARVLVQAGTDLAQVVFAALASVGVPADLVARSGRGESEFRMGFTVPAAQADRIGRALRAAVAPHRGRVEIDSEVGKVSLVGTGLLNRPELTARLLSVLAREQIPTSWLSATQLRTSVTVPRASVLAAVALLHDEFDLAHDDCDIAAMVTR